MRNDALNKMINTYHRVLREAPLPDDPRHEREEANDQGAEHVGTLPRVTVATGLESDQEQRETDDGQGAPDEVDTLKDLLGGHAFGTHVRNGEVGHEETDGGDTVVDEGDPHAPAPRVVRGEQLAVEHIWREREDEGSEHSGDISTVLDWHGLIQTEDTQD